jgi:phosphoadenosine phosphosulfate reductase
MKLKPKIKIDIDFWNKELKNQTPNEIINWALQISDNKIVTTSFGIYSEVLLSAISNYDAKIKVIWCDTLFNKDSTYDHAKHLISKYALQINRYQALRSKEQINSDVGLIGINDDNFEEFSNLVKIEPFRRALKEHNPDVWFTNIRVSQTEYRNRKDILSFSKDGILKVSPFYYWSNDDLDDYVKIFGLKKNEGYFDPIKALNNRECGIHFQ